MDKKKNINIIDTIYTDATYAARYGLDIFLTILIVGIILCLIGYFSMLNNLQSLRANWDTEKCKPTNLPFVHIINPDPNLTAQEQINNNINECLKDGVKNMAMGSLNDIFDKFNVFHDLKTFFDDFVQLIQSIFLWLFNTIAYLMNLLLSLLQKTFLGFTHIFLKIDDMFNKFLGIIVTNLFIFIQILNMGIAFILNFASIATIMIIIPLKITLVILLGMIVILGLLILILSFLESAFLASLFLAFLAPPIGLAIGILSVILALLLIAFIGTIIMLIIMTIIAGALIHIQNTAQRFIAPSLKQGRNVKLSPQFPSSSTTRDRANNSNLDKKIKNFLDNPINFG